MKRVTNKFFLAFLLIGGLCVGIVKGQDARTKWINRMKFRNVEKKSSPEEIALDEFELKTFHN